MTTNAANATTAPIRHRRPVTFEIFDCDSGQSYSGATMEAARAVQDADAFGDMTALYEAGAY